MAIKFATIEIRKQRGKMIVQGTGRTPRGQKYIKQQEPVTPAGPGKKNLKAALATAIDKLLGSG